VETPQGITCCCDVRVDRSWRKIAISPTTWQIPYFENFVDSEKKRIGFSLALERIAKSGNLKRKIIGKAETRIFHDSGQQESGWKCQPENPPVERATS
jgi:hypothetical protein